MRSFQNGHNIYPEFPGHDFHCLHLNFSNPETNKYSCAAVIHIRVEPYQLSQHPNASTMFQTEFLNNTLYLFHFVADAAIFR